MTATSAHDYLDQHQDQAVADLSDLLTIPSIAAQAAHAGDVRRAAEWVAARMTRAGIEHVALVPTALHPAAYGDWLHAPGKPTILVYGHFDVMPPGPLERWTTPPFEPTIRDSRLYARGASDDKGNMYAPILAAEALLKTVGALPLNVKFIFEGQEEMGSPHLAEFVAANRDLLACDLVINADSGQESEEQPVQLLSTRGICGLEFAITGPRADVHSGMHGGSIQNPLHAIAEVVASFHDAAGRVTVDGFYDGVVELTAEERAALNATPWNEEEEREKVGVPAYHGDPDYTVREQTSIRPTLEVNGLWGGYVGEGPMTVIPSEARAKISCRLVANQDPQHVLDRVIAHIEAHTPPGVRLEISPLPNKARAYQMPSDHSANLLVSDLLEELYHRNPWPVRTGGSVPILAFFHEHLNAHSVGFGFGLPDEGFHGPDEYFRLASFARAQHAFVRLFERLASWEAQD